MKQLLNETWKAIQAPMAGTQAASEVSSNSALAAERTYLRTLRTPKLPRYQVDAILNIVVAEEGPSPCGKYCGKCDNYAAYRKMFRPVVPACVETVHHRERRLKYYFGRLFKAIRSGLLQVWNDNSTESIEPPDFRTFDDRTYHHHKRWLENSFLFPEDLARFCDFEKIRLIVFDPTQPDFPVIGISGVGQEKHQSTFGSETQPSTISDSRHFNSPAPVSAIKKQQRFDLVGAELNEIMMKDSSLTPTQVMRILIGRVGGPNSCVVANDGDSVRWEDSFGRKRPLNQTMLNDRLRRWHLKE